jgi:predicted Zn finger-like uncharacterized protein
MKIECPVCSASGNVDESKVPQEGREVTCPRCKNCFKIFPERSPVETIQKRERMVCPKCSCEQPMADTCAICGITVKEYLQTQLHQQDKERLEFVKLRSETRQVDAWYSNLFDRRLSSLVVRVLSLLVLLGIFMTCSMNSAKRNRYYAENTAEMRKATEGPNRSASPERNDSVFKERFNPAVELLISSTDDCLSQNYNYKSSWYQNAQPYFLTENLADNLNTINRKRREAESAFNRLPSPSKKYLDCHVKLRGLSNLNREVCSLANSYSTYYPDFSDRLSNINFEFSKTRDELNACREIVK